MIHRELTSSVINAAAQFPVVAILGPRQSGKTTLVQNVFPNHRYVSFEDLDMRTLAIADPRGFLQDYPNEFGIILDEIQHVPTLLSYIQTIVDKQKKKGHFIITGSQNLLVNEAVTQTLAGRIALLTLFPLSLSELNQASLLPKKIETALFKGSYPRIYADNISPEKAYANYIRTYVERDVRQIKNITNLTQFQRFLQICAGRIGQVLNLTSLGNDCGIDQKTVRAWLSILEASYVIVLLYPYYKNFGKRLIKSPKLYFTDTGIACSLLNIKSPELLLQHYMRGNLVESLIVTDFFKQYYNLDQRPSVYFWRDHQGNEIDAIIEEALHVAPIEIKAGKTVASDYFKQFEYWKNITSATSINNFVVYAGEENQNWPEAKVISWKHAGTIVKTIQAQ
jgi:predicted AAA+ superfamily ATPase